MSELIRRSAAELAALIHTGEVSAVEVTQAHLDRIAAVDTEMHAFLHVAAEPALAAAAAVDASLRSGDAPASPLAGVPLALKDVFTTSDMPTTCGSRILEGWRPPYDATVTQRLREAGIVILGKTNMDEFAMGSSTEHSAYGPTRNPWDTSRIPGGSGGGSAASLASFEAPLADRHRHRRLDPAAGRGDRHGRCQADLRRGVPVRAGGLRVLAGPGRPVRADRARRRAAARGDRRARPAGLHLDRRAGAVGGGGRPRRAPAATCVGCGSAMVARARRRGLPAGRASRLPGRGRGAARSWAPRSSR